MKMKINRLNSIFRWIAPSNWSIVKVYRDFENYADWRRTIRREERNVNSKYNKWKLNHTKLYDIYTVVSLDESDAPLPATIQRTKVIESLNPLHRYLDEELGFADCLNCDFNQYEDENRNLTLSYLIVYRFRFEKFSIKWVMKMLLILSIMIYFINKYNLLQVFYQWVLTLI